MQIDITAMLVRIIAIRIGIAVMSICIMVLQAYIAIKQACIRHVPTDFKRSLKQFVLSTIA